MIDIDAEMLLDYLDSIERLLSNPLAWRIGTPHSEIVHDTINEIRCFIECYQEDNSE